jgi:NDP-sugar pyrophosphorylase family protein
MFPQLQQKFFILLGGLGTRLRSEVSSVPKPMAPICGKPFLWYKLMQLKSVGITRFVFLTGYLAEIIEEYFGDGSTWELEIEYSVEKEPLGTGGALKNAARFVDGPFFMGNGDSYYNFIPTDVLKKSEETKADYFIVLTQPDIKGSYGIVNLDESDRILDFIEKPDYEVINPWINAGIYYFTPKILDLIPEGQKCSIEREIFPKILSMNEKMYAAYYKGYFIDIGIPENYRKFISDVEAITIHF